MSLAYVLLKIMNTLINTPCHNTSNKQVIIDKYSFVFIHLNDCCANYC